MTQTNESVREGHKEKTRLQLAQGREDFLRKKLLFFFLSLDGKMPVFRGLVAATSQFDFESKEKYFNCIWKLGSWFFFGKYIFLLEIQKNCGPTQKNNISRYNYSARLPKFPLTFFSPCSFCRVKNQIYVDLMISMVRSTHVHVHMERRTSRQSRRSRRYWMTGKGQPRMLVLKWSNRATSSFSARSFPHSFSCSLIFSLSFPPEVKLIHLLCCLIPPFYTLMEE